jgi:hypothetical protein
MDKYEELMKNVGLCFQRVNYINYFHSSEDEKSEACRKERDQLAEYINSEEFSFRAMVEEKLKKVQEREDYIMKNY